MKIRDVKKGKWFKYRNKYFVKLNSTIINGTIVTNCYEYCPDTENVMKNWLFTEDIKIVPCKIIIKEQK